MKLYFSKLIINVFFIFYFLFFIFYFLFFIGTIRIFFTNPAFPYPIIYELLIFIVFFIINIIMSLLLLTINKKELFISNLLLLLLSILISTDAFFTIYYNDELLGLNSYVILFRFLSISFIFHIFWLIYRKEWQLLIPFYNYFKNKSKL
jgi:hypothetical protein